MNNITINEKEMLHYISSFSMFAVYLIIEKCIQNKITDMRIFNRCVAIIGIIGLIIVNISKVFILENFFLLIFASAIYELYKSRKQKQN